MDDGKAIRMGDSFDFQIYHNTGASYINASSSGNTSDLNVLSYGNTIFKVNGGSETALNLVSNGATELYHSGSKKFETLTTGWGVPNTIEWHSGQNSLDFYDGKKASFGGSRDLQIYHDSNNSLINAGGTGNLIVQSANDIILRPADGDCLLYTSDAADE